MPQLAAFNVCLACTFAVLKHDPLNYLIAALWLFLAISWWRSHRFSRR